MDAHPEDRIGVCLDIDGTIYRSGSVFVETLIRLPDAPGCSFTAGERAQLRTALGTVGRYQGGRMTAWRWRSSLRLVDTLRGLGMETTATELLARFLAAQAWLDAVTPTRGERTSEGDYETLRSTLLHQYGTAVAGHDRASVVRGVEALFRRLNLITAGVSKVCADARQAGIDLALVTDMPAHIARPYAEMTLGGSAQAVVGTKFNVKEDRFTGAFDAVDKGAAVKRLRDRNDWEFVIAAGDTGRDLAMARAADHFIAVSGQGHIRSQLDDPVVLDPNSRSRPNVRDTPTSYVPPEQGLSDALRFALGGR